MRVLLVEDDRKLQKIISVFLEKEQYVVEAAASLQDAEAKIAEHEPFDLVILDLILPDGSGIDFCRQLRSNEAHTPILMLSTRSATLDRITGLDAGADDYMPKPFSPKELSARMRALLRRPHQALGEVIACGDIEMNILSKTVKTNDQEVRLMPKEYSLLEYLIRHKNQAIRKEELLRNVWGVYSNTSSNRLEVYIRYLREKLHGVAQQASIRTIRGTGYMIADD